MDYYMNGAGIASACIRDYETDYKNDLPKATAMTLKDGKAMPAADGDVILGVLASDFYAEKDELIPDSGNGRVRVIITPCAIYKTGLMRTALTAKGTKTSISVAGLTMPSDANALKGGFVRLVSKTETSENTDHVGCVRRITASSANTLTLEEGGVAGVGDVYEIIAPAGFCHLALSDDAKSVVFAAAKGNTAKVVCALAESDFMEIIFTNTVLG